MKADNTKLFALLDHLHEFAVKHGHTDGEVLAMCEVLVKQAYDMMKANPDKYPPIREKG